MKPGDAERIIRFNADPRMMRAIEDRVMHEHISKAEAARRYMALGIAVHKTVAAIAGETPPVPPALEELPLVRMAIACTDSTICTQPLKAVSPGYNVCSACHLWEGARKRGSKG